MLRYAVIYHISHARALQPHPHAGIHDHVKQSIRAQCAIICLGSLFASEALPTESYKGRVVSNSCDGGDGPC